MKYVVCVPDGCADEPIEALAGRTPLEAADTPVLDALAARGEVGRAAVIPPGLPPGSDVGNMSILGFDPAARPAERPCFGLTGMRERARLLGGRLRIESNHGAGTVVRVWVPMAAGTEEEGGKREGSGDARGEGGRDQGMRG